MQGSREVASVVFIHHRGFIDYPYDGLYKIALNRKQFKEDAAIRLNEAFHASARPGIRGRMHPAGNEGGSTHTASNAIERGKTGEGVFRKHFTAAASGDIARPTRAFSDLSRNHRVSCPQGKPCRTREPRSRELPRLRCRAVHQMRRQGIVPQKAARACTG